MRTLAKFACLACAILLSAAPAAGYETDQFTNRAEPLRDSTAVLNRKVNDAIEDVIADWRRGPDEMAVVNGIYRRIGGLHWVDRLERWANESPAVDKQDIRRYGSIYADKPLWSVRVTRLFGIGKTIRINDELVGSDKIGHFLSQGRKFYRRYRRSGSEAQAAKQSALTERALFGAGTTGAFSNADLVANYEGHRFYRSLFEDDIVPGKPAILRWQAGRWIMQREFDWADHVNAYWDEALNVNRFDSLLYQRMRRHFVGLCPAYWEHPSLYVVEDEGELQARYAHIGLADTRGMRLDGLCPLVARMAEYEAEQAAEVTANVRP